MGSLFLFALTLLTSLSLFAATRAFKVANDFKLKPSSKYIFTVKVPNNCDGRELNVIKSVNHTTHKVIYKISHSVIEVPPLPPTCFEAQAPIYYAPLDDNSGEVFEVRFIQDFDIDAAGKPVEKIPNYSVDVKEIN